MLLSYYAVNKSIISAIKCPKCPKSMLFGHKAGKC